MNIKTFAFLAISSMFAASCSESSLYDPDAVKTENRNHEAPNTFNYSTVQEVNLTVDYSAFKTYGQVFFSIYSENPFVGEGDDERLDENIRPIYEDFTDAKGKFSRKIELPSFATRLYVVTGNFFVSQRMMEVEVQNGAARAVAVNNSFSTRAGVTRSGNPTSDVSKMPHLSFLVNQDGSLAKDENGENIRIYKDWLTPLGTWDSQSGKPNYLIQPGQVDSKLLCSPEDISGLYSAIGHAFDTNKACSGEYRNHPDLMLDKESEVTITMLGGSTCWNSSLGYYYYFDNNQPQKPEDLNIIMLFPNTQDGHWTKMKSNYSYNGNIGVEPGDAVLLKYYPNIANENESMEARMAGATTKFPAGIRIGFILKTHGWGMQGSQFGIKGYNDSSRKYNVWGASTSGTSFCQPFGTPGQAPYQYCNPDGESRSAKFAYNKIVGEETEQFAIVTFEDACNDQDYDDVIFALKPVNSFTPLPEIEDKIITTTGVYAFEDLWPSKGDYDLNDVVVDYRHDIIMSRQNKTEDFKIYKETFNLTTYQNYVVLQSGLALKLTTDVKPSSIVMKKRAKKAVVAEEVNFKVEDDIYYLTSDVKAEIGTTYILELNYAEALTETNAKVQPFIYREEESGKTWEVHIPYEAPTKRFRKGYFGMDDDASDPDKGIYFVRSVKSGNFPFAIFLSEAQIGIFDNTILQRKNESISIDTFFDDYKTWVNSNGAQCRDWYRRPKK